MTTFRSTRSTGHAALSEAVFRGLAPDGGLYVPVEMPVLPDRPPAGFGGSHPHGGEEGGFAEVARWAAPCFFPGVAEEMIRRVVERALTFPTPLVEVEPGRFVLELFHGPTHAFKDVGARFMAALMVELDAGTTPNRIVLVATSGDTGGAVADAFHGLEGYRVVVLFPRDGISAHQRRQMTTLGKNVHALAVQGTFDDCQRVVKEAFLDAALRDRHGLTSANSINVARLLPQALYFVYAAHAVEEIITQRLGPGAAGRVQPRFVVPSGNLGNLCAGLLARRAGMAASGFIAATNANRGFVDFLSGDEFEARSSVSTVSSAMDVGDPSNFERVQWLYDGDDDALRRDVIGVSVSDAEATRCIADVYERTGYVLDPHTAVGYEAAKSHNATAEEPTVILATAHPAKFPDTVEAMIGCPVPLPPGLARTRNGIETMCEMVPTLHELSAKLESMTP